LALAYNAAHHCHALEAGGGVALGDAAHHVVSAAIDGFGDGAKLGFGKPSR
tara:strand:+ start:610 stop:762 length:153 start_codon:yes stop_codon:yes gene_type:complete